MIIRLRVDVRNTNKSLASEIELNNHGLPMPLGIGESLLFE